MDSATRIMHHGPGARAPVSMVGRVDGGSGGAARWVRLLRLGLGLHIVQPKCAVTDPEIQEDLEDIKTASSSRNEKRHRE